MKEEKHYREVSVKDRLPKEEGPYFVKMKEINRGMAHPIIFVLHDIYIWEGEGDPNERELWINTFEFWLEKYSPQEEAQKRYEKAVEIVSKWIITDKERSIELRAALRIAAGLDKTKDR